MRQSTLNVHLKINRKEVETELESRNINYEITSERYGSNLKTIYVDRFIHDHTFFNRKGYGIKVVENEK